MRIIYTMNRRDLFRANIGTLVRSQSSWLIFLSFAAVAWWGTFAYSKPEEEPQHAIARLISATIAALFYFGGGVAIAVGVTAIQTLMRKGVGELGIHTLEISEVGLQETTPYNSTLIKWTNPLRIRQAKTYILIHISDTNGLVIPRNRPLEEGDLELFIDELRRRIDCHSN